MLRWSERAWASLGRSRFAHASFLWYAAIWVAAALVYAGTTARDVLPADSGEFQLIAAGWGIGHPPGYPLYTVVVGLWVHLFPAGPLPYRASLLSPLVAATTLTLCARVVALWASSAGAARRQSLLGGGITALSLGSAATFWAQATTANIRMPTMLFVAWGYLALARYRAADGNRAAQRRSLTTLALVAGLGVGHHPSLAFVAIGWVLYLLLLTPRLLLQPGRWASAAGIAAAAWLVPQLYLPLRGSMDSVPLNPGDLATWQGFWDHVLARGFGGDMLAFATPQDLALRVPLLPTLFRMQFPTIVLIAVVAAWGWLLWRDRRIALSLLVSWLVQTFFTITYRAPQTVEYLMPAYVPMALALGLATAVGHRPRARTRSGITLRAACPAVLTALVVLAQLLQLPGRVRDFGELANDRSVRDRVQPLLQGAPPQTTVLADWRWATPLWVIQATEGVSPQADVRYVYPEDSLAYESVWLARAEEASDQPLFTTHYFAWDDWSAAPVGGGYRLYQRPLMNLPPELGYTEADADLGPIRVLGFRWVGEVSPGNMLELQLAWQATGSQDPTPSLTTRLWDSEQVLLSAADQWLGSDTEAGEIRFATLNHQIPIDRCDDTLYPTVGAYATAETGFAGLGSVSLPPLAVDCRFPKLPMERIWPGVVFPQGPILRGIDYDTQPDGSAVAYLHWCGPGEPLLVSQGAAQVEVLKLALGACQTTRLALTSAEPPEIALSRRDGVPVTLLGRAFPAPHAGERYLPFGSEIVLVGDDVVYRTDQVGPSAILTLRWRAVTPLRTDYAVSTRLQDAAGNWLGMHDMQPGLGAIPTLKWVTRGDVIRDPHPFPMLQTLPSEYAIAVYERFRITPLRSPRGDVATYRLP